MEKLNTTPIIENSINHFINSKNIEPLFFYLDNGAIITETTKREGQLALSEISIEDIRTAVWNEDGNNDYPNLVRSHLPSMLERQIRLYNLLSQEWSGADVDF